MNPRFLTALIVVLLGIDLGPAAHATLTTNNWNTGTGNWEIGANWLQGVPSTANAANAIVNTSPLGGGVITVDATTVLSNGVNGCMTISNLTVSGTLQSPHTLFLNNAGTATPLHILNSFINTNSGGDPSFADLNITNSALQVDGSLLDDGVVTLNTGTIITTNTSTYVGNTGLGRMTLLDGTWQGFAAIVGYAPGSQGTLTIAGGTNIFSAYLAVGFSPGATGTVWLTGGDLNIADGVTDVGDSGTGQMTVSNGTWLVEGVTVGANAGSQGTLTVAGGTNTVSTSLDIGAGANAAGKVWLTGGQLIVTNTATSTVIGDNGVGQMEVSNGAWSAYSVVVGYSGGQGTLTIAGGTNTVNSTFNIARIAATGAVWLKGGLLTVTNAVTYIGSFGAGRMTVSNGTWLSQNIVLAFTTGSQGTLTVAGGTSITTNLIIGKSDCSATGTVVVAGGSLFVTNAAHNAVLDLESGSLTLSGGTLTVDVLVKTNPCATFTQTGGTLVVGGVTTTISSLFKIGEIGREGNNMRIGWQSPGGVTNIVQATNGGPDGSYNTNFVDLSPPIVITGVGLITTNYLDAGGATNLPSRFYRVRLVP
jgi:hypothetical protein